MSGRGDRDEFAVDDFRLDESGRPIPTLQVADEGPGALATIGQRAGARLFDFLLVVFLPGSLLLWAFGERSGDQISYPLWVGVAPLAFAAAYEIVLVATRGATLGKALMGIEVVRYLDGGRPTWGMSAIRFLVPAAVQSIPVLVIQVLSLLVYLRAAWDPMRRGFHDRASGTLVLRTR